MRLWLADIDDVLELADFLIHRDRPIFTGDVCIRFGFEGPNQARAH
jgi:hypothetical protein